MVSVGESMAVVEEEDDDNEVDEPQSNCLMQLKIVQIFIFAF